MGKYSDLFEVASPVTTSGKYADLFDGDAPEPQAPAKSGKYADLFDAAQPAPAQDYMPVGMSAQDEASAIDAAPQWMQNAGTAAVDTASAFIPRDLHSAASLVNPVLPAWEQAKTGYKVARDTINGKPFMEALNGHDTLARQMSEAERTPPYSKERFGAGLNVLAQLGMAYGGAKGAMAHMGEPAARKGTVEAPTAPPERPSATSATETPAPTEADVKSQADAILAQKDAEVLAEHDARIQQQAQDANPTTSDNTRAALDWRKELMQEQVALAKSAKLETAIAGRPTAYTENRLAEIDAELKRGYHPPSVQPPQPETPLQQAPEPARIPTQDEFARELPSQQAGGAENVSGQQRQATDTGKPGVGLPENQGVGGERGRAAESGAAGTSNRVNTEVYGADAVPSGQGVDTTQLLDNARASLRSGAVDPYSVLSRTRANGIANAEEYAALAAEHERLVNDAVAKQKANDPTAPEAAKAAEDFANAIQPHKTAASDLMRLFQGDINYDLSTPFGMNEYMKAELGRGMKPSEAPKFEHHARNIRQAESNAQQSVARADARVRQRYAKVRDIPIEEAAARVKSWLKDCIV